MSEGRLTRTLDCAPHDRVPFIPAIYEQKAWLVGSTPSVVCRDPALLRQALLAEYEELRPDALTVGIDVYNIEAEAAGSKVTYADGDETSIPAIASGGEVLHEGEDVRTLRLPDPARDGRMPMLLEVARRVRQEIDLTVPVRGCLTGPFSLAANLVGAERLFLMLVTDPAEAAGLLDFAAETAILFGKAFLAAGCGVVVFDSQASPMLLSPDMYRALVLPPTRRLVRALKGAGARHVPLIIGGDTTPMLEAYLATEANDLLCDARADLSRFLAACRSAGRAFRRNIDSARFLEIAPEEVYRRAAAELAVAAGYPGFILGTGVVPFGTPLSVLYAVRRAIEEHGVLSVRSAGRP